jgi:hypothetical protein
MAGPLAYKFLIRKYAGEGHPDKGEKGPEKNKYYKDSNNGFSYSAMN